MAANTEMDEALDTFIAECRQLLEDMEVGLMRLDANLSDTEAVHAVFRAAHTIKGSAGLFGLEAVIAFTHELETLLSSVREGAATLDGIQVALLMRAGDQIARLIDDVEARQAHEERLLQQGAEIIDLLHGAGSTKAPLPALAAAPDVLKAEAGASERIGGSDLWHLSIRFGPGVLRDGFDPASFIRHLRTVGRVVHIVTLADRLPRLPDLDPETCHLGFELRLQSAASKAEIEAVFDFVLGDCELHILPPDSRVDDYLRLIEQVPDDRARLGEILVACGALTAAELELALAAQQRSGEAPPPLGRILVEEHTVPAEVVEGAIKHQQEQRQRQGVEAKLVRIHADKLDGLIDRVAELIIASASVGALAARNQDRALKEAMSKLSRLTEDVRDGAMRLRLVEIGDMFGRFRRVVRDVADELGKDIRLSIEGGETELDKTLVDRLADPLTHMIRNAVDHGIESPAMRLSAGKPAAGQLTLKASHLAGSILIEISDDGAGLHRDRILAKAVERGLLMEGTDLSDEQVWALIFEPGFSTAAQVSNLSGRGVGMDVVKRAVEALRGSIEIHSTPGQGTRFRIRLPLTLAIIDGFLLAVGQAHYVVPLASVLECVRLPAGAGGYLDLRGEVLPLIPVGPCFGVMTASARRQNVVVVDSIAGRAGLVVDQLKGEIQAVVKPLGPLMAGLPGLSGSTILGTGEVALMLDVASLIHQAAAGRLPGAGVDNARTSVPCL